VDPQLEFFLEDAFQSVTPTSPQIGRVVVEPDYDVSPDSEEREGLVRQLVECVQEHTANETALASPQGDEIQVPDRFPVLAKYIRSITLHREPAERPWVEVVPPGNWI